MLEHNTGPGHPERPARLQAISDLLQGNLADLRWESAAPATRDDLIRVHDSHHVDHILGLSGQNALLDPDTVLSPRSVDAALLAAGLSKAAVHRAYSQKRSTFALVRPPGHHAEAKKAMGFCIFNNVAIAAAYALAELGISRVLVVDWDVHHGNGTQHIFYDRRDVLFFSTHQSPLYPGTGDADETGRAHGAGYTINVPLPAGAGDDALLEAFHTILLPAAAEYEPQLVLVSAGFDAHRLDPIGGMTVTTEGFAALTEVVAHIAHRYAEDRLALILEGGYDLQGLSQSVLSCVQALSSPAPPNIDPA